MPGIGMDSIAFTMAKVALKNTKEVDKRILGDHD
jgi:hypothetical protein